MKDTDDIKAIKAKARQTLSKAPTEDAAVKDLEAIGLIMPVVSFSEPDTFGQMMKMGMAFYEREVIYF